MLCQMGQRGASIYNILYENNITACNIKGNIVCDNRLPHWQIGVAIRGYAHKIQLDRLPEGTHQIRQEHECALENPDEDRRRIRTVAAYIGGNTGYGLCDLLFADYLFQALLLSFRMFVRSVSFR